MPKQNPPTINIGSISVRETKEITAPCGKVLSKLLENRIEFSSPVPLARGISEFSLQGAGATGAIVEKKSYSVLPIQAIGNELYWLGVILQVKFEAGFFYLSAVSIIIVKGLAEDNNKTPILRAEWDCLRENLEQNHAQPHWHIYPSSIIKNWESEEIVDLRIKQLEEFGDLPEEEEKFPRFHFAMATKWHLGEQNPNVEPENVDSVAKWINFCIQYTLEQLTYMWKL